MLRLFFIFISSLVVLNFSYGLKKEDINKKLTSIRIPFIENEGQVDKNVKFYAKTFGGTLFVTKDGKIVYRTYNTVSLGEVYKGIELKLKAYGNNVEKIFEVKPKANPKEIVLKVEGAKELKIDEKTGQLIVRTELGDVKFTKPIAYQDIDGKKVKVEVRYKLISKDSYGFEVGKYDRTEPLIIDPLLASTYVGGGGDDIVHAIALDTNSVYIIGETWSSGYPHYKLLLSLVVLILTVHTQ